MAIIDTSTKLYNYDLWLFLSKAGVLACWIGYIVTIIRASREVEDVTIIHMPALQLGLLLLCISLAILVPFEHSNKDITCYKVALEPSFTEEEFNAITADFFIDSYKDGIWYLEELNPNNEAQR